MIIRLPYTGWLTMLPQLKIFWAVVCLYAVLMVNLLPRFKEAAKHSFHNNPVFEHVACLFGSRMLWHKDMYITTDYRSAAFPSWAEWPPALKIGPALHVMSVNKGPLWVSDISRLAFNWPLLKSRRDESAASTRAGYRIGNSQLRDDTAAGKASTARVVRFKTDLADPVGGIQFDRFSAPASTKFPFRSTTSDTASGHLLPVFLGLKLMAFYKAYRLIARERIRRECLTTAAPANDRLYYLRQFCFS